MRTHLGQNRHNQSSLVDGTRLTFLGNNVRVFMKLGWFADMNFSGQGTFVTYSLRSDKHWFVYYTIWLVAYPFTKAVGIFYEDREFSLLHIS